MPAYQRFVTYLFQYNNGEKGENCGFAKVEVRHGTCNLEIQVSCAAGEPLQTYLYTRDSGKIVGVCIGEIPVQKGTGRNIFVFPEENLFQSPYGMGQMCGLYLTCGENSFIASQWDDEVTPWEDFVIYDTQIWDTAVSKDVDINETLENELDREEETEAEEAPLSSMEMAAPAQTSRLYQYASAWEREWQNYCASHPVFHPFDEEEQIYAVKMNLQDMKILPRSCRALVNNSFLLHGFYNYKYLLFGYVDGEEKRWFLAVPGVFQNQEQLLAGIFGFPNFRTRQTTLQKTGEFGYWYRFINI